MYYPQYSCHKAIKHAYILERITSINIILAPRFSSPSKTIYISTNWLWIIWNKYTVKWINKQYVCWSQQFRNKYIFWLNIQINNKLNILIWCAKNPIQTLLDTMFHFQCIKKKKKNYILIFYWMKFFIKMRTDKPRWLANINTWDKRFKSQ